MSLKQVREEVCRAGIPDNERQALLSQPINRLSLKITGTWVEPLIQQMYRELEERGIYFHPQVYLSDEWGCPSGIPVIGIPFYLADPVLCDLEARMTDIEAESESEVMMYLRHEAGHSFNYAYQLYTKPSWRRLFGRFSAPYSEDYRTVPFNTRFVRHIPGWYAQKHPDDDFAETFAVWLDPASRWREKYAGIAALPKLEYIERLAKRLGRKPPIVNEVVHDRPVENMTMTLGTWYDINSDEKPVKFVLPEIVNVDLCRLFSETEGQPAAELLHAHRRQLIREVNYWTGVNRLILSAVLGELIERVRCLNLKVNGAQSAIPLTRAAIFLTVLAMNHQSRGIFIE